MQIKLNGKKISRKKAIEMFGEDKMNLRIKEAQQAHTEDPLELIEWMDGMEIYFK